MDLSEPQNEATGGKRTMSGSKRASIETDDEIHVVFEKLGGSEAKKKRESENDQKIEQKRRQQTKAFLDDLLGEKELDEVHNKRSPSPEIRAYRLPTDFNDVQVVDDVKKTDRKSRKRKTAISEEQLGDEDHISRLPFDCLLSIFSNLTRGELLNMMQVNRRLHQVANDRSLYRGKAMPFGCLSTTQASQSIFILRYCPQIITTLLNRILFQVSEGYLFMLSTYDNTDKKPGLTSFSYKVQLTDVAKTREVKEEKKGQNLYAPRLLHPLHNLPVPGRFTEVMSSALNKFAPPNVVFSRIRLDESSLDNLSSSVLGIDNLFIEKSTCDRNSSDSFTKFVKSCGIVDLTIIGCPQIHESGVFNMQFLTTMKCSALRNLRSMEAWDTYQKHTFYLSKSKLSLITRYDTLILPSLTVNVGWIGDTIMNFLSTHDPGSTPMFWNIGLDRMPNPQEIKDQFVDYDAFKYKLKKNGLHRVINKANGFMALFHIVPIPVNEGNSLLYLLDIVFAPYSHNSTSLPYFKWYTSHNTGNANNTPDHMHSVIGSYRPNLLTPLTSKQPANFFASQSTVKSMERLQQLEIAEKTRAPPPRRARSNLMRVARSIMNTISRKT